MRPRLEETQPDGRAVQFVRGNGGKSTFFLSLCGAPAGEDFCAGELLAVSEAADAEPGDLVVWWYGTRPTLALARMAPDLSLQPVAGFPAPARKGRRAPRVRGVVVGRLRRAGRENGGGAEADPC